MEAKQVYDLRHRAGWKGTAVRVALFVHQRLRPPHLYPDRNQQFRFFQQYLDGHGDILMLGSNMPAERLQAFGEGHVTQVDIKALEHVDVVADAERLSEAFEDKRFDYVVASSMLEHTPHPWRVVEEAARIMRPGGYLYLSTPWFYPLHGEPHDYWRFSMPGLRQLIAEVGLEEVEAGSEVSPHGALEGFLKYYFCEILSFNSSVAFYALEYVFDWLVYPIGLLERFFRLGPRTHYYMDSMLFVLARKPGTELGTALLAER